MDNPKSLFNNNTRVCENCKRPLPHDYKENLCPRCLDLALFREVKEFIRTHDVNEYEVAEHFKIPLRQVKSWIKDGRIEYKQSESASTIAGLHCQRCGAPVTFGTLCPKCLRLLNGNKGYSTGYDAGKTKSKMYHWKERSNYSSLLLTFDLYFFSTSVRNLSSSSAFISTFSSGDLMTIS